METVPRLCLSTLGFHVAINAQSSRFFKGTVRYHESSTIMVLIEIFFLLAGALLYVEKIRQKAALLWFGLRDVGIFYSPALIQRTIVDFPAFLEHSSAEKDCDLCP
jgi:hypothetical protein